MSIGWNIKYAASQFQFIIIALMVITYARERNKVNKVSVFVFLLWTVLDTVVYFFNFKQFEYHIMYIFLPLAWFSFYYWKGKKADWLWKQLDIKK